MMRYFLILILTLAAAAVPPKLVFERAGSLYTANPDGSSLRRVCQGLAGDLSPDGSKLVFIRNGEKGERFVAVAALSDGKAKVIKGQNCLSPAWSPDGTQIAYCTYTGSAWNVALMQADGSDSRVVLKEGNTPRWAPDGQSLYVNLLDEIAQVNLQGKTLKRWKVPKGQQLSSSSALDVSPDGRTLVVNLMQGEEPNVVSAIWKMDLASGKFTRIVDSAWECRWVSATDFVYLADSKGKLALYRQSPKGRKLLVTNAGNN